MKIFSKKENLGITLIALVITIVVLIILASATINIVFGNNGLLNLAKRAREKHQTAANEEALSIASLDDTIKRLTQGINGSRDVSEEEIQSLITQAVRQELASQLSNYATKDEVTAATDGTPIGTIIAFSAGNVPSANYLKCEGQEISRTEYDTLFGIIGTTYGEGDGSTTFKIPDLRGEFLRGTGTNSHTNSETGLTEGNGASVGSHQEATVLWSSYNPNQVRSCPLPTLTDSGPGSKIGFQYINGTNWTGANDTNKLYTTRPTNTSVQYCIKVK